MINNIIIIEGKYGIDINYISVDGDNFYQQLFDNVFNQLSHEILEENIEILFQKISDIKPYPLSDFLHILKNARTRLLFSMIKVNPFDESPPIHVEILEEILHLGNPLTEKSSLAKMRDQYPLNIFTIYNAIILINNGENNAFYYVLLYALWNEALTNPKLAKNTRFYLLQVVLICFIKMYNLYVKNKFTETVSENNTQKKLYVTFCTKSKMIRIIITLIAVCSEFIKENNSNCGLDRLGNHPIENYIGLIRSLCNSDHRYETVIHNVSRHILVNSFEQINPIHKRKRANLGGLILNNEGINVDFGIQPQKAANIILSSINLAPIDNENDLISFINNLIKLTEYAPYLKKKIPSSISGASILTRIVSFNSYQNKSKAKRLKKYDSIIDHYILLKKEKMIFEDEIFKGIPEKQLCRKISARKNHLSKRPWAPNEDAVIKQFMIVKSHDVVNYLQKTLISRSKASILMRMNELK